METANELNALVPIQESTINDETVQMVSARKLHAFLEVKTKFADWITDRIEQFEFVQGVDFVQFLQTEKLSIKPLTEYDLTLDMAKELSMVERNERGKQARQYFIACEKKVKQMATVHFLIPKTLPEALRLAANLAEEVDAQKAIIHEMEPKAEFHDAVTEAINCHTVQEVAKVIGTGEIRLFKWLRENGLLMNDRQPYQRHIDAGYFRMVEKQYTDKRGESHTYNQTLVTGKGLVYIQQRFGERKAA